MAWNESRSFIWQLISWRPIRGNVLEKMVMWLEENDEPVAFDRFICVGGTFDMFHEGHRQLLGTAARMGHGRKLLVGITSDEFGQTLRERKIRPFRERKGAVSRFLEKLGIDFEIVELNDFHGPAAADPDITTIIVSKDTKENAERINRMRMKASLPPLEMIVIDMVLDENDIPLSSTRIAEGQGD